jgi:hypothetical protein
MRPTASTYKIICTLQAILRNGEVYTTLMLEINFNVSMDTQCISIIKLLSSFHKFDSVSWLRLV